MNPLGTIRSRPAGPRRSRRKTVTIGGMLLIVALSAAGLRLLRAILPLTASQAARVAREEVSRRDPAFAADAQVVQVAPREETAGRPWNWAYRWEVVLRGRDAPTGYFVEIDGRENVKVGLAYDIRPGHWSYDEPR